ncbi:MAG: adenylate kinase [Candidatus Nanohaloarchaea archaeon]
MGEVNIIVGLSGVGKSTVIEEAMLLADKDYEVINYGDRMLEVAREQGLVDDRDELKEMDSETQRNVQRDAAKSIVEDAEDQDVLVDTHAAIKTPFGFIPGLPRWTLENLEPSKLVVIDADPEAIFSRSQGDDDREREHDSVEDVELYRDVAREMAVAGAVQTGAYLQVIENREGKAEKAAEELVKTLRA